MKKWKWTEIAFALAIAIVIILAGSVAVVSIGRNSGWFSGKGESEEDAYKHGVDKSKDRGKGARGGEGPKNGGADTAGANSGKKTSFHKWVAGPGSFGDENDDYVYNPDDFNNTGTGSGYDDNRHGSGSGTGDDTAIMRNVDPAAIFGFVKNLEGSAIGGATIRAFNLTRIEEAGSITTDASGYYSITVGEGDFVCLKVEAPGYSPRKGKKIAAPGRKDFILDIGASLELAVIDNEGEPISKYTVQLSLQEILTNYLDLQLADIAQHIALPPEMRTTESLEVDSEDGRITVPNMTPGSYSLIVRAKGYAIDTTQSFLRSFKVKPGKVNRKTVRLNADKVIKGIVLDEQTGEAVSGACIKIGALEVPLAEPTEMPDSEVYSDSEGKFELHGLPGTVSQFSNLMVIIEHPEYAKTTIYASALNKSKSKDYPGLSVVEISALVGGVEGRVTDVGGNPIVDIPIALIQEKYGVIFKHIMKTDGGGYFRFDGMPVGRYRLCRLDDIVRGDFLSRMIDIKANETIVANLNNVGSMVTGLVTFKDKPFSGALITLRGKIASGEIVEYETTTGADGIYTITGVPEGKFTITAQKHVMDWDSTRRFRTQITIEEPSEIKQDIVFSSTALTVKVVDEKGKPPVPPVDYDDFITEDNMVTITPLKAFGSRQRDFKGRLRENGEIGFSSIPEGEYRVEVKLLGYEVERKTVNVKKDSKTTVTLKAKRLNGTITGYLVDAETGQVLTGGGAVGIMREGEEEPYKWTLLDSAGKFLFFIPDKGVCFLQPHLPEWTHPPDGKMRLDIDNAREEIEVEIEMVRLNPEPPPEDE